MVLQYIIKKVVAEYGKVIVSDLRLYNILSDLNAFKYGPRSLKFIIKQVLVMRGKEILESYKHSQPAQPTLCQYIQFITSQCGFVEEDVRYVVESIAYGIGWISQLSECPFKFESFEQRLEATAYIYNLMGMNITQISGSRKENDRIHDMAYEHEPFIDRRLANFDSFKNPIETNWKDYIISPQNNEYITNLSWKNKTGIGTICGYNNIRAIDIDGCFENDNYDLWDISKIAPYDKFISFLEYCLHLLNLPKDYQWVVKSGSGKGIHIIFKCEDVNGLDLDIAAFTSKELAKNEDAAVSLSEGQYQNTGIWICLPPKKSDEIFFTRLELFWKGHLVAPPSKTDYYSQYEFINTPNAIPLGAPQVITINDIDNLLVNLCGKVACEWYKYDENRKCYSQFYHMIKLKNSKDSMGGYNHFKDSYLWLQQCKSAEGINSLGVYYVQNEQYDKAADCFKHSNSEFAYFNLAEMIVFGYINGSKEKILLYWNNIKDSKRIYQDSLRKLKKFIDEY